MTPRLAEVNRFAAALPRAVERRTELVHSGITECFRTFAGGGDGCEHVFIDVYGPGAVLIVNEGSTLADTDTISLAAEAALAALQRVGVKAVYAKPFAKDRSKLGGIHPDALRDPTPAAGEPLPESIIVREHECRFEARLWDGFSTGLFLDQRENRRELARLVREHAARGGQPPRVLNTFAYTCGFSVSCALAGAHVASVDVSPRYLDWGKRNFTHNALDPASPAHRFARMDTFEFLDYARRKALLFDLIILDPPSFASADKRRGIRAWSSTIDYARLVERAAERLDPRGMRLLFASTNTLELCRDGGRPLEREIVKGLGAPPTWLALPPAPIDFAPEPGRFAARLCRV
ncbi:MAG: class I SAM-dependent methyltransferase [Phycisphaerales bacterium]